MKAGEAAPAAVRLYDVASDPRLWVNIAPEASEARARAIEELEAWQLQSVARDGIARELTANQRVELEALGYVGD